MSPEALGIIDTCFLASYALGQFVIPSLLNSLKINDSKAILIMYSGAGAVSIIFGYASNHMVYNALWCLNGFLHSAIFPLMVTEVNKYYTATNRGRVLGAWTTSQQVGAILSTMFAAYISAKYGWRFAFLLPGGYTVIIGLLYFVIAESYKRDPESIENSRNVTTVSTTKRVGSTEVLKQLFKTPDVGLAGMAYFFVKFIRYSLLFWLPYYFAAECNYPAETAGYISTIFDVGGIIGGILAGQIADLYLNGRRLLCVIFSSLISAILLVGYSVSSSTTTISNLTYMGSIGIMIAASDSIIGGTTANDVAERCKISNIATVSGVINGFGAVGAILQGYVTTTTTKVWGWKVYYAVLGASALASVVALGLPAFKEGKATVATAAAPRAECPA